MYGGIEKCKEQKQIDETFFKNCDKGFKTRKEASAYFASRGWDFFREKDYSTAMKRFNQAWMLDSANANVYWGFADLLSVQRNFHQALPFFERTIALNPSSVNIWQDAAQAYYNNYIDTKDLPSLNTCIIYLKKYLEKTSADATSYAWLADAYSNYSQKDSARKYVQLADAIDTTAVSSDVREVINGR